MHNENTKRKRERNRRYIWNNNDWEFPQNSVTKPRIQEVQITPSRNKYKNNNNKTNKHVYKLFSNYRKLKVKRISWKKQEEKYTLLIQEQR